MFDRHRLPKGLIGLPLGLDEMAFENSITRLTPREVRTSAI
jgi:hypothetical protein